LNQIVANDALTRGLGDAEARILIEWLVERAEHLVDAASCDAKAYEQVQSLCRRGRAIGRFVALWSHFRSRGAAGQLAAAEGFTWPLPPPGADPYEIMQSIVHWESDEPASKMLTRNSLAPPNNHFCR
jgi:hypothetical protein